MTGRSVFGDFTRLAAARLQPPAGPERARSGSVAEAGRSLLRLTSVLDSYLADVTTGFYQIPSGERRVLTRWARAGVEGRDAIRQAALYLRQIDGEPGDPGTAGHDDSPARRLAAAASALAAGRDLLHTHVASGPDGIRTGTSEWAPAVTSVPVSRALLGEIAEVARRAAAVGTDAAVSQPGIRGTTAERQQLAWACQWLQAAGSAIRSGLRRDQAAADGRLLLYAIPVNTRPTRRVPGRDEPVTGLCDGTVSTAQRLRHNARTLPARASWSPAMTITGLREIAVTSTVTSRNCEIILRTLAGGASRSGARDLTAALTDSADAAGRACAHWLRLARDLKKITTDTRGYLSPAAAEAEDLALWTGRLAYADPAWNLASGPSHEARPARSLAAEPGSIPAAVAAVHQAFETLTHLATSDHSQVQAAAAAGRLLVPTTSLPATADIPHPFAPAPPHRVRALLDTYRDTGQASMDATAAIDRVAAAVQAPSQVLTRARAAVQATRSVTRRRVLDAAPAAEPGDAASAQEPPGPVGQLLRRLGVTRADLLKRAADLDHASYELIMTAADDPATRPAAPDAGTPGGSADLLSHALASPDVQPALPRLYAPARAGPRRAGRQAEP